jgi:hypothetical protein
LKTNVKVQGNNNCFRLSAPETGHLVAFCLAEDNNPLFLIVTFIRLSRVHEASIGEAS